VKAAARPASRRHMVFTLAGALVLAFALGAGGYFYFHRAPKLTDKDSIILADFTNTTGDPVFDGTLRQGLSTQLEQSPFFNIVSGDRIAQTLRLMEQQPDARLTADLARQVCARVGAKAEIDGSIAALDNQYVLGLNAVDCQTGEALAQEQGTADGKTKVLAALGGTASRLRSKLGESRPSLKAYDVPLVQATTSSLEALQAYTRCDQAWSKGDLTAGITFCQQAVNLDPSFAAPYALLSTCYAFSGDSTRAAMNAQKAYDLRDRVSEWEKFAISGLYHSWRTGDFDKAAEVTRQWSQTYPRDARALAQLGFAYRVLGRYDQSLAPSLEAVRVDPTNAVNSAALAIVYLRQNRLDEARAAIQQAEVQHLSSPYFGEAIYWIAFLRGDETGMAKQANQFPADMKVSIEALTGAYRGHLSHSQDLTQRAIASAAHANANEVAASFEATAALWDALFGNISTARNEAIEASKTSADWNSRETAALALALAGDIPRAQTLSADLNQRFPEHTFLQFSFLPAIRAAVALHQGKPQEAIESLRAASTYELGEYGDITWTTMMPVYGRGEAYLAAHQGSQAAAEFQKILDHGGIVLGNPIGALAHLGLARAYTLEGDTAKAKAGYQDFLTLWKDADPDIPILKQAKAEYAKLR
jgi:tetratricopeptide (TPR) repeat protein